jgi:indole-3-glycerol phosphate synthase
MPFFKKKSEITLIAECKKGSPSAGILVEKYDPVSIAQEYALGGASALSVLTEQDFFSGDDKHLTDVKKIVSLPVLRKDFLFDAYQVKEAWAIGADAILLIAAILSDSQARELGMYAKELGMEVLLEVHGNEELERGLKNGLDFVNGIGINARNLGDFSIDLQKTKELCKYIPKNIVAVAESGIRSAETGFEMRKAGFRGFLVGEYFMKAKNREICVREFVTAINGRQKKSP